MHRRAASAAGTGLAHAFWAGLTAPTWASLIGAVLVALAELGLCCLFVTPRRLTAIDGRWIQERPNDEYARLSVKLLRWHYRRPAPFEVTYVGASWATRALAELDEPVLSAELSGLTGQPVHFNVFTANNQRYEDALLIAEQLPPGYRGVFVVMVTDFKNDYRNAKRTNQRRGQIAALRAPALEAIWARQGYRPRRSGVFFLDHLDFFAARRIAALRFGPPGSEGSSGAPTRDEARFEDMLVHAQQDKAHEAAPPPLLDTSFGVIDKLMEKLGAKGVTVVLLEAPDNPVREAAVAERLARYREDTAFLASERGAEFWSFQDELDLAPGDFQDHEHLGSPTARARFEHLLLVRLADLIDVTHPAVAR